MPKDVLEYVAEHINLSPLYNPYKEGNFIMKWAIYKHHMRVGVHDVVRGQRRSKEHDEDPESPSKLKSARIPNSPLIPPVFYRNIRTDDYDQYIPRWEITLGQLQVLYDEARFKRYLEWSTKRLPSQPNRKFFSLKKLAKRGKCFTTKFKRRIPWLYPENGKLHSQNSYQPLYPNMYYINACILFLGCYIRAYLYSELITKIAKEKFPEIEFESPRSHHVFGNLEYKSKLLLPDFDIPTTRVWRVFSYNWQWHVAPIVQIHDGEQYIQYILDAAVSPSPTRKEDWYALITQGGQSQITGSVTCRANAFISDDNYVFSNDCLNSDFDHINNRIHAGYYYYLINQFLLA